MTDRETLIKHLNHLAQTGHTKATVDLQYLLGILLSQPPESVTKTELNPQENAYTDGGQFSDE